MDVADNEGAAVRTSSARSASTTAAAASTGYPVETHDSGNPPLLRNDDILDTVLTLCNLQSIGRLALTCRRLSAFVADPSAIFWFTHLVYALGVPSTEVSNVKLGQGCEARTLLESSIANRRRNYGDDGIGWEYHRDDTERTIAVKAIGWNRHQIDYVVDDASSVYSPGHDFSVRYHPSPMPASPSPFVRRRRTGDNVLDVKMSSIFYFEVNLVEARGTRQQHADDIVPQPPCVAIGLSTRDFELSRFQPGWTESSTGYHSDDGHVFFASGSSGTPYGPTYGANDCVGCGIHIPSKSIFYTKNGTLIGTALILSNESTFHRIYPTIGIDSSLYSLHVNFGGEKPFVFDVSKAEGLYAAYPPPSRRSRRLNGEHSASAIADPSVILLRNHLTCKHNEAATFHPWNADAITRRIQMEEGAWDSMSDDGWIIRGRGHFGTFRREFDYNSYDDSSFAERADTGGSNDDENGGDDTDDSF